MDCPSVTQPPDLGHGEPVPKELNNPQPSRTDQLQHPRRWKGLGRIAGFFCLVVLLAYAVDVVINNGLRRIKTSSFGVSNQITKGTVNANIVISGSSRAIYHYDCRILQSVTGRSVFNIGRNGSQTDMQVAFLKTYLRHNARPSLVIHNLDLFSFVTTKEVYDPAQYFPYLDEPDLYSALHKINPEAWKWKTLPLYAYVVDDMRLNWIVGFKGILGWEPREDQFAGFVPRHLQWTGDFERFKEMNPDGVRFEIEPRGVRDLQELAEICRDRGIPLLFVYSPVYSEMQPLERNRVAVFARFNEICRQFQVPLWDYSDSNLSRNRDNFYNSQHLNADGAAAFSDALAHRLAVDDVIFTR